MRIRLAVPDELDDHDRKEALDAALEAVTIANKGLYRKGVMPRISGLIKSGAVKWKPEPPGDEHFDLASTVIQRGWGDCDDLAPAWAGQLRASGTDPQARAFVRRSGPTRWHALVRRGDGTIEDPSRHAGMGHNVSGEGDGAAPSICKPMSADPRLCLAICPTNDPRHGRIWFARCDAPDASEPWAWSGKASHSSPAKAIVSAIKGLRSVAGDDIDEEDDFRLQTLNDLVLGADPYEVIEALDDVVPDDVDPLRVVLDGVMSLSGLDQVVSGASGSLFGSLFGPAMRQASAVATGNPAPKFTPHEQRLSEVFIRYVRGEQPSERGGRRVHNGGFSLAEVQQATAREHAYEATLSPADLARRKAKFADIAHQGHRSRRGGFFRTVTSPFRGSVARTLTAPARAIAKLPPIQFGARALEKVMANPIVDTIFGPITVPSNIALGLARNGPDGALAAAKAELRNPVRRAAVTALGAVFPPAAPAAVALNAANVLLDAVESKDPVAAAKAIAQIAAAAAGADAGIPHLAEVSAVIDKAKAMRDKVTQAFAPDLNSLPPELLAMLAGSGVNAPPTSFVERGIVTASAAGVPSFMRF
jgi:hypothetical protein